MKKLLSLLALAVLVFVSAGCQEKASKENAALAGQAELKLSCVAEFIRSDGSRYLTEQKYEVSSNPKAIVLTAKEPFGKIAWSVRNGAYTVQKGVPNKVFDKELYSLMMDKDIATGLLEIYLAGLRAPVGKAGKEPLKFQGQLYEPAAQIHNAELYRNQTTGKLDLVTSGRDKAGKLYLIHGYNYLKLKKIKGQDGFYPSKLDIYLYRTDFDKELIVQISCFLE
jgi:hypothetical protein